MLETKVNIIKNNDVKEMLRKLHQKERKKELDKYKLILKHILILIIMLSFIALGWKYILALASVILISLSSILLWIFK